jgi:hypothetical protein
MNRRIMVQAQPGIKLVISKITNTHKKAGGIAQVGE